MKMLWKELGVAILMCTVLPNLILNFSVLLLEGKAKEITIAENTEETIAAENSDMSVSVRFPDGSLKRMNLDVYLTGVVLGEMNADFEPEALKAQAVAARTYTAKAVQTGGKHGDGSLCTNYACCQAYIAEEDYLNKGGTEEKLSKVRSAVLDTSGRVLTYEGELIEATYFSCSGGYTEDAAAVWGTDYPYLRSVSSPGEENATHYCDTICFTKEEFEQKTGSTLSGKSDTWFTVEARTPGGGIGSLSVCGEIYTGTQLRNMLGLPSTSMTITASEDTVTIVTKGYGHRVGMSQYGADAMAVTGCTYPEILAHYYPGTQLESLS